ncbi:amino acid adenylation domain-containing protein [Streptomyces sp. NPDC057690]|uniref:non-ribosomal peptide synthetase n=1 Tax=Streptomyces sp. NPDC057690 TaxID=3346214 RepID=UPI0036739438
MSEMIKRLARLPEDRRAAFIAQLRAGGTQTGPRPAAAPTPADRPAPLSFAQETLWFLDQLAPGQATYNVGTAYRITGALDVEALRRALRATVARHETLRTAFGPGPDGGMLQHVLTVPEATAGLLSEVHDLAAEPTPRDTAPAAPAGSTAPTAPARAAYEAARRRATALGRLPFDLTRGPLWRAELLRLSDDDHMLVFVVHHVVFDGWSGEVFTDDLAACYAAETGMGTPPPPPPVQYGDYAHWQRERLSGAAYEKLAAHWRERLTGAPTLDLPTDRPRPAETTYRGTYRRGVLAPGTGDAVRALAGSAGVRPYVVHLAAFLVLLHRYTDQDDLVVGTPTANRDTVEVERIIGFFVNMLVLRTDLSGAPSFREVLRRVDRTVQEAFDHGELPFERVVDAVRPARDPSRSPLFQVVFAFQDGVDAKLSLPGLTVEQESLDPGTSRFDLSWNVSSRPEGLVIEAEFNSDLFDPDTVDRLLAHYGQVLASVTADPDTAVSRATLLTPDERAELLTRWNGPRLALPEVSVPEMFRSRARQAPEAVALVVGDEQLDYAELERRANRLAHLLRQHGAAPGERVALCLDRTPDLVVAVLAVLFTGAAYVPVDPGYPPARMTAILDDATPVAVVAHAGPAEKLTAADPPCPPLLVLDRLTAALAAQPDTAPAVEIAPTDVAYVLYTSGTTGRPKGVLIEHRSVIAFVRAAQELFGLTEADRVLGYASANFDVSVGEMFNALLTGARLHLVRDDERLDMARLQELLETGGITVTDLPPTVMALLDPERLTALRIVFVGGEAFPGELVNAWNPGRRFFNGYGPTECTVTMIVHECPGHWTSSPPIGLPIANHVGHVLDQHFEPVPYGVAGELVIGGAGLTRGYLGAPELTREKVVPDPFGSTPDGRLYRTGDLVRRRRDGSLVFVGRIDQQVKIRGLRIELGDVEAALATFPGIGQLAVVPWTDPHGERHLVAYTTFAGNPPPAGAIRAHLADRLPAYMVPPFHVTLDTLPLTVSGKVDHRRLPAPETSADTAGSGAQSRPRTTTEHVLATEIFAGVLRRETVGIHDHFFELGGNSLQAAQLMARIGERFQVRVGLAEFFRSPTVAHLAAIVDRLRLEAAPEDDLLALIEGLSDEEAERLATVEGEA